MFKKFIALAALVVMMPSAMAIRLPDVEDPRDVMQPPNAVFSDVAVGHENFVAVEYLASLDVVVGYGDGKYKPDNEITRAEFLKIVMEASPNYFAGEKSPAKLTGCFADAKGHWAENYICEAQKAKVINGYPDGNFRPNENISFVEAAKVVANAMDLTLGDVGGEWYENYVKSLELKRAIPPTIGAFDQKLTRGEMAEMVWRLIGNPPWKESTTLNLLKDARSAGFGELETFDTCADMGAYYEVNMSDKYSRGLEYEVAEAAPMSLKATENVSADSYSETNVQVAGVDEADIVKNDGQYIYLLKNNRVKVVKAFPADEMTELDEVVFEDSGFYPSGLYLDGEQMVVVGSTYSSASYGSLTRVYVLDVSDRTDAKVVRNLVFEGAEVSTRRVGEMLYLVLEDYQYEPVDVPETLVPEVLDGGAKMALDFGCDDIYYYPGGNSTSSLTVAAVDLESNTSKVDLTTVVGSSGNVYASPESLYVAEYGFSNWFGWGRMAAADQKEETVIHKFSLGKDVAYEGEGRVPGHLLNQFSMDEHDGNFRVATTLGDLWNEDVQSTNNVYVLNEEMNVVGRLEGVAPGEKIYSVRFMGDRAYMVTFKKVDPFYVLDLANASNPSVLGELKLPGYSDYLHPFGENYVIGFGKDAVEASVYDEWSRGLDFAWYQGMKVAMFDVRDVKNPKVAHSMVIGDRGTESELLYNHKALMFDAERGIMAFPIVIAEIPEAVKNDADTPDNAYGKTTFDGAVVYSVDEEDGFELIGRVSHYDEDVEEFFDYNRHVLRALYMDDFIYTLSYSAVKANNLEDFDEEYALEFDDVEEEYYSN